jgi:hypothetical protein
LTVAILLVVLPASTHAATAVYQPSNCFNTSGSDGCGTEARHSFSSAAVASPDGKQVYSLSSAADGAIVQYDRDVTTAALTRHAGEGGCVTSPSVDGPCTKVAGVIGAFAMVFSADGTRAYVTAYNAAGLVVLKRDTATGELTALGGTGSCFNAAGAQGCTTQSGLYQSAGVAIAPDGKNVYVTSLATGDTNDSNASISIFDMLSGGGLAPHAGNFCFNSGGVNGCAMLSVGAIGGHSPVATATRVYAPMSTAPGGIVVFARDGSGGLAQAAPGCLAAAAQLGCTDGDDALASTFSLALSSDGGHLYAGALNAVVGFTRSDSALTEAGCISASGEGGCAKGDGLSEVYGMALSADGTDLAVGSAGSDGVAFLARNPASGALSQLDSKRGCVTRDGSGGACRVGPALGGNSIPSAAGSNAFYFGGSRTGLVEGFRRDQPPECADTSAATAFGTPVELTLTCSDPDGDALAYSIAGPPASGTLGAVAVDRVTYTPSVGFSGDDHFSFSVSAFGQIAAPATARVTVAAAPPPVTLAGAKVRARWKVTRKWTRVASLVASALPAGTTVRVKCHAKGKSRVAKHSCAFGTKQKLASRAGARVDLTPYFKKRHLVAGTRIDVRLTKPGATPRTVRFTTRRGKKPLRS